ncbi:MAG: HPr family phosphocarrier protein [Nanoarchaeota archaeon]|nr:HPr family phosphocarrier protein [Nanoarchaeota archaeon]
MKTVHELYVSLTDHEGELPKVMSLDNQEHRRRMDKHIGDHFDEEVAQDGATIDNYLHFHRDQGGELRGDILVRYNSGNESVYFELSDIEDSSVQEAISNLKPGGDLRLHLRGNNSAEIAEQLRAYVPANRTEPEGKGHSGVGITYGTDSEGYEHVHLRVSNKLGLHARPAAMVVKECQRYFQNSESEVLIAKGEAEINGRSILGVMMLAAEKNQVLRIRAKGPESTEALNSVYTLFENKFGEE